MMETRPTAHPTAEILVAFGQGKLDDVRSGPIIEHVRACIACRDEIVAISGPQFIDRLTTALQGQTDSNVGSIATAGRSLASTLGAPDAPPPVRDLPTELGHDPHHEVLRELGRGGMGVVYLARHRLSKRLEVLKVMNREMVASKENKERFLREIESAARLDHPNVVKMHTASELGNLTVLVMEYVEGDDIGKILKRGPLPVQNACYYAHQVALGLQEAHEQLMVHRDIKPQNLIVTDTAKKQSVKILNFGLAKVASENRSGPDLTGSGLALGTPHYMAPEQATNAARADIRADIYSLGCTLYHMLAGTTPFVAESALDVMIAHKVGSARPVEQIRPEIPAELAAVVAKMMAKKPEDRFQSPAAVADALALFIQPAAKSKSVALSDTSTAESSEAETIAPSRLSSSSAKMSVPDGKTVKEKVQPQQFEAANGNFVSNATFSKDKTRAYSLEGPPALDAKQATGQIKTSKRATLIGAGLRLAC